jgi:hypothetical protein
VIPAVVVGLAGTACGVAAVVEFLRGREQAGLRWIGALLAIIAIGLVVLLSVAGAAV